LAKTIALPNCPTAFSRLGNIKSLHNCHAGAALSRSGISPGDHAVSQTTAWPNGSATRHGLQDSIGEILASRRKGDAGKVRFPNPSFPACPAPAAQGHGSSDGPAQARSDSLAADRSLAYPASRCKRELAV
jgi:hypothetical protein